VVIDLYSRTVMGWSMKPRVATELVLDALTIAVWRTRPKAEVIIHANQGSRFACDDFNCWGKDNACCPA
jgi:putative transposase